MIINGLTGCNIVFDTKNWNIKLDTLLKKVMTWRLIGIFFGVITLFIILSGYLFNWML